MPIHPDPSPAAKSKTRTRTVVRTGCHTCKVRKVKCDERRPQCAKCTTTGRTCDGYVEPPPIQRTKTPKYPSTSKTLSTYRPQEGVSEHVLDRQCFAYFRCRVVQDISGCFEVDFWDRLVPQLSHAEPTVMHALLALSALYECISSDRALPGSPEAKLALRHYTKAVGFLASGLASRSSPEVVLVSCLVFVWFEFIQNNLDAGLNHLQAGLHILNDVSVDPNPRINASIPRVFTRLRAQARLHGSPTSNFNSNSWKEQTLPPDVWPCTFTSLSHARSCLDDILDRLFTFSRHLYHSTLAPYEVYLHASETEQVSLDTTHKSLLQQLQKWHFTFQNMHFAASELIGNTKANAGILLLELHHLFATKAAQIAFWASEMQYDELMPDYQRIVSLAGRLIHEADSGWVGSTLIYFDIGVIAPLYFVALKCRQPVLRRTAISLLKQAPEREGMWLRKSCVQSAEWKVKIEEYGHETLLQSGGTVPESARVNHEQAREVVVEGKSVTVLRYRQGGIEMERILDRSAAMGELL